MNSPQSAYFRERYHEMDDEELALLLAKSRTNPDFLADGALEALSQVINDRSIDVASVLAKRQLFAREDQLRAREKVAKAQNRSQRRMLVVAKIVGWAGLLGAAVILILSIDQNHIGGIFTSLATAACSAWLAFWYKGD